MYIYIYIYVYILIDSSNADEIKVIAWPLPAHIQSRHTITHTYGHNNNDSSVNFLC